MTSLDGAQALHERFGVDYDGALKAIDTEAEYIRKSGKRVRYDYSIEKATDRVSAWIGDCGQYNFNLNYADLARFVSSHRPACVWAVLAGRAIRQKEECKKCGSDLKDGYCTDETCPYDSWPQYVNENDMYVLSTGEMVLKYHISKRTPTED